jgi:uncharacterized protein YciI
VASIFIASLTYTAPIARVDAALADHLAWLKAGHEAGRFLAWGPREPRDGGLIFVKAASREEAERLLATDPFMIEGLADLTIIQWTPRQAFPGLEAFHG